MVRDRINQVRFQASMERRDIAWFLGAAFGLLLILAFS